MILTTLLAAAALYGGPIPVLLPPQTSEPTAEGVEILRRILVEELDQSFATQDPQVQKPPQRAQLHALGVGGGIVTRLWAGEDTVEHARAFHLPEVGLFLSMDLSLPVVAREEKPADPKDAEARAGDEWERIRREVRGSGPGGEPGFVFQRVRVTATTSSEIDPQAIETVIDRTLRTVARHASRIEGLGPNETVTIAMRLEGRHRLLVQDDPVDWTGEGQPTPEAQAHAGFFSAYAVSVGRETRVQNLVIRVPLTDLGALAESPERLRQRAQINLY